MFISGSLEGWVCVFPCVGLNFILFLFFYKLVNIFQNFHVIVVNNTSKYVHTVRRYLNLKHNMGREGTAWSRSNVINLASKGSIPPISFNNALHSSNK